MQKQYILVRDLNFGGLSHRKQIFFCLFGVGGGGVIAQVVPDSFDWTAISDGLFRHLYVILILNSPLQKEPFTSAGADRKRQIALAVGKWWLKSTTSSLIPHRRRQRVQLICVWAYSGSADTPAPTLSSNVKAAVLLWASASSVTWPPPPRTRGRTEALPQLLLTVYALLTCWVRLSPINCLCFPHVNG